MESMNQRTKAPGSAHVQAALLGCTMNLVAAFDFLKKKGVTCQWFSVPEYADIWKAAEHNQGLVKDGVYARKDKAGERFFLEPTALIQGVKQLASQKGKLATDPVILEQKVMDVYRGGYDSHNYKAYYEMLEEDYYSRSICGKEQKEAAQAAVLGTPGGPSIEEHMESGIKWRRRLLQMRRGKDAQATAKALIERCGCGHLTETEKGELRTTGALTTNKGLDKACGGRHSRGLKKGTLTLVCAMANVGKSQWCLQVECDSLDARLAWAKRHPDDYRFANFQTAWHYSTEMSKNDNLDRLEPLSHWRDMPDCVRKQRFLIEDSVKDFGEMKDQHQQFTVQRIKDALDQGAPTWDFYIPYLVTFDFLHQMTYDKMKGQPDYKVFGEIIKQAKNEIARFEHRDQELLDYGVPPIIETTVIMAAQINPRLYDVRKNAKEMIFQSSEAGFYSDYIVLLVDAGNSAVVVRLDKNKFGPKYGQFPMVWKDGVMAWDYQSQITVPGPGDIDGGHQKPSAGAVPFGKGLRQQPQSTPPDGNPPSKPHKTQSFGQVMDEIVTRGGRQAS